MVSPAKHARARNVQSVSVFNDKGFKLCFRARIELPFGAGDPDLEQGART